MADQAEDYEQGVFAYQHREYERAYPLLLPFAEAGDAEAQAFVGSMFQLGLGRPFDEEEAAKWYLKASEQGHGLASNNLGTMAKMRGDSGAAKRWYEKAREQGFPHSPR